jgi:hypothetical protein
MHRLSTIRRGHCGNWNSRRTCFQLIQCISISLGWPSGIDLRSGSVLLLEVSGSILSSVNLSGLIGSILSSVNLSGLI